MIQVLYEDDDVWCLEKPAGIPSVSLEQRDKSIATDLLKLNESLATVSDRPGDAGLVNRLDSDTSGILIGAKTRKAWEVLRYSIQQGKIEKSYLAIVTGEVEEKVTISNFIGSPYRRGSKVRIYEKMPGPPHRVLSAETVITPLKYHNHFNVTLIQAFAPTARRHQIRAHCSFIGHPLVGDVNYRSMRNLDELKLAGLGARTFFLHADHCVFLHPVSGKSVSVDSPKDESVAELFRMQTRRLTGK